MIPMETRVCYPKHMHLPCSHPKKKKRNIALCQIGEPSPLAGYKNHLTYLTFISTQLNQSKVHTPTKSSFSELSLLCMPIYPSIYCGVVRIHTSLPTTEPPEDPTHSPHPTLNAVSQERSWQHSSLKKKIKRKKASKQQKRLDAGLLSL